MLSLFRFIISKNDQLDNEFCELSNTIERGEITPNILAKYCMPKKSFYELNFFSEKNFVFFQTRFTCTTLYWKIKFLGWHVMKKLSMLNMDCIQ